MHTLLKKILTPYLAPAGDEGSDTGGADMGTAVADLDDDYMALPEDERRRLRGDLDASEVSQEALQALVAGEGGGDGAPQPSEGLATTGADGDDVGGQGARSNGIPRTRFNEVNEKRQKAEELLAQRDRELAELRAQIAAQNGAAPGTMAAAPGGDARQSLNIEEAEEQYAQLMLDGDTKAASKLRMQINTAIGNAAFDRFNQASAASAAQAQAAQTVESLLQTYPWLDEPEGAEALELIEASVLMKMGNGVPRHQALAEAVQSIAPRFAPGVTPAGGFQGTAGSGDIRPERAMRRGAADSMLQPAGVQAGMGNRASPTTVDSTKLSDDEYMALPEAERKRLRGD